MTPRELHRLATTAGPATYLGLYRLAPLVRLLRLRSESGRSERRLRRHAAAVVGLRLSHLPGGRSHGGRSVLRGQYGARLLAGAAATGERRAV
jgi:hypothetical protein